MSFYGDPYEVRGPLRRAWAKGSAPLCALWRARRAAQSQLPSFLCRAIAPSAPRRAWRMPPAGPVANWKGRGAAVLRPARRGGPCAGGRRNNDWVMQERISKQPSGVVDSQARARLHRARAPHW